MRLINNFEKFKSDVDGIYSFLQDYYEEKYKDTDISLEQLQPLIDREQQMIDEMVVGLLNTSQNNIELPSLIEQIQKQIDEFDERIASKENGPFLYDEEGSLIDMADPDMFFFLEDMRSTFVDLKSHLENMDKVRKAGKPTENKGTGSTSAPQEKPDTKPSTNP